MNTANRYNFCTQLRGTGITQITKPQFSFETKYFRVSESLC